MNDREIAKLATCNLFRNVSIERFADFMKAARYREHEFRKGGLILLQGCVYASLYILLDGSAYAEMTDDEGRCMRVETFAPVEALASAVLFSPKPVLPVTVGAQSDCRIISFPKEEIIKMCMSEKAILEGFLADSGARVQFLSERLRLTRFATLRQRIADWLVRKAQAQHTMLRDSSTTDQSLEPDAPEAIQKSPQSLQQPISIRVEPSFEKMADLMGVARPSLSRELSHMRSDGLIDMEGRTIILEDIEALKNIRNPKSRQP